MQRRYDPAPGVRPYTAMERVFIRVNEIHEHPIIQFAVALWLIVCVTTTPINHSGTDYRTCLFIRSMALCKAVDLMLPIVGDVKVSIQNWWGRCLGRRSDD